jgi:hypothetical protein
MEKTEPKDIKIELDEFEIQDMLHGINRCTERLGRLIGLHAPIPIIEREVQMIQRRALTVLSCYEAFCSSQVCVW